MRPLRLKAKYGGLPMNKGKGLLSRGKERQYFDSADHFKNLNKAADKNSPAAPSEPIHQGLPSQQSAQQHVIEDQLEPPPTIRPS